MTYDEFKKAVMSNMKDYLTEEYQDFNMRFQTINKSSGYSYEALMVEPQDRHMSVVPALNITEAYEQLQDGMSFEAVMNKLADVRMHATIPEFNKDDMFKFDKISDRIFPRLINTEANMEYLADKPHKEIEDLSIIYAVRISENESGFADAVITNDLANAWGVDTQEIHSKAMDNIAERPPLFQNIEELLFGEKEAQKQEIEDIDPDNYRAPFFVLTNQQKTKGAVMAINPKIMDRITAKLGDVYVIPSSVDETLIIPKSVVDDPDFLRNMVREVNASEVKPEDQLSNNVYEYDAQSHTLRIVSGEQTEGMSEGDTPDPQDSPVQGDDSQDEGPTMSM